MFSKLLEQIPGWLVIVITSLIFGCGAVTACIWLGNEIARIWGW